MPLYRKSLLKNKTRTSSSFVTPCQSNNSSALDIVKEDYKNQSIPIKKRTVGSFIHATKSQELLKNNTKSFENQPKKGAFKKRKAIQELKNKKSIEESKTQPLLTVNLNHCVRSNIELNEKINSTTESSLSETMKYSQGSNSSSVVSPDLIDMCCSNLKLAKEVFQSNTDNKGSGQSASNVLKEIPNAKNKAKVDSKTNISNNNVQHNNKTKSKIDHRPFQDNNVPKQSNVNTVKLNKESRVNSSKKHHLVNKKTEMKPNISMKNYTKKEVQNKDVVRQEKTKVHENPKLSTKPKYKRQSVDNIRLVTKEEKKPFKEFLNEMDELREFRNVGLYVYCDACNKVRFLPDCKDPQQLPEKWFCYMNPDPKFNSCSYPNLEITPEKEQCLIQNKYNAGSIVWARCEGYPWWPAMVEDDPNTRCYFWLDDEDSIDPTWYNVTFFDRERVTRCWIKTENLRNFETNVTNRDLQPSITNRYYTRIQFSKREAIRACQMSMPERLKQFGFVGRYYSQTTKQPKTIKVLMVVEERRSPIKKRKISEKITRDKKVNRNKSQNNDELNANLSLVSDDISLYLHGNDENTFDNINLNDLCL